MSQAPAMFPLLNMIREQAAATLIYESGGRMIVMHFVAFVLSLGCLTFYPNPQHVSPDAEILTHMRLVRQIYEHTKRVILPLCGAYELQLTAELTAGLGQTTPDAIVRASSQLIAQAADLMESKAAYVQLVVSASVVERDAEIQRLAHIKWFGDNVIKSLSSCRTNVRFLKEIVHHVTRWAAEVREDIQDELNPPSRNVRPRLAEPDQEPQPANAPPPGPPAEVDELEQDLE